MQVDSNPFKKFYNDHYDVEIGKKKQKEFSKECYLLKMQNIYKNSF